MVVSVFNVKRWLVVSLEPTGQTPRQELMVDQFHCRLALAKLVDSPLPLFVLLGFLRLPTSPPFPPNRATGATGAWALAGPSFQSLPVAHRGLLLGLRRGDAEHRGGSEAVPGGGGAFGRTGRFC